MEEIDRELYEKLLTEEKKRKEQVAHMISCVILDYNSSLAPHIYQSLLDRFKRKSLSRFVEYAKLTKDHYQELLVNSEDDCSNKIHFKEFPEETKSEEIAAYFTRYILLIILKYLYFIHTVSGYTLAKRKSLCSVPACASYLKCRAKDLDRIFDIQKQYFRRYGVKKDISFDGISKATSEVSQKDYLTVSPVSFFSESDAKTLEVLLNKLMHSDCFLRGQAEGVIYKNGREGIIGEMQKISTAFLSDFIKIFKVLQLTNMQCSDLTHKCLELVFQPAVERFAHTGLDGFVYSPKTIEQKIKTSDSLRMDYKEASLKDLLPLK